MRFIYGEKIKKMKQKVTIVDKTVGKVNNTKLSRRKRDKSNEHQNIKVEKDYIKEVSDMLINS